MPRAKVRCGSAASPAEFVTFCQPSYAHRTPSSATPAADSEAGASRVANTRVSGR